MKKKIKYILLSFAVIAFSTACNDFLDKEPISDLGKGKFWKSADDAEAGTLAIYNAFSKAMATGLWDWGEFRSDNFIAFDRGADDQRALIENTLNYEIEAAHWTELYSVIGRANDAIQNIPNISMNTAAKNKLLGEAYAMRAWAYFYCVRVWGDVPVFLEPVVKDTPDNFRPRTDKNYIIENIILPDLEQAYSLMPKPTSTAVVDMSRVNIGLICALLMDVNAWIHDYEAVVKIKEERMNLFTSRWQLDAAATGANFVAGWRAIFYEGTASKEVLFKLTYEKLGNGEHQAIYTFAGAQPRGTLADKVARRPEVYTDGVLDKRYAIGTQWNYIWDLYPTRTRLRFKFWPDDIYLSTSPYNVKSSVYSDNDLVLYRYADITLLYAEALNEIDRTNDAITELNRTRTRAGAPAYQPTDFTDKEELVDAILNERQREFIAEGKRWFDLVRMNRWRQVMEPINGMNQEWQTLFPIHRDHLIQNKKIVQNTGYQK